MSLLGVINLFLVAALVLHFLPIKQVYSSSCDFTAKQKLYCYVDENGQDTKGDIFIVSVVVTGKERDRLLNLCEEIEVESGKGKFNGYYYGNC